MAYFIVMGNLPELPLRWKLTYDEVLNGVYAMQLTWDRGLKVETTGTDFEDLLAWGIASAHDIEEPNASKRPPAIGLLFRPFE